MTDEHDEEECTCVPDGAVILRELHVIEFMMPDGTIEPMNFSNNGADEVLDIEGTLYLAEWAKSDVLAPLHAMAIARLIDE